MGYKRTLRLSLAPSAILFFCNGALRPAGAAKATLCYPCDGAEPPGHQGAMGVSTPHWLRTSAGHELSNGASGRCALAHA